jgi:transcriptional regulator GlxA family with amidase domain
LHKLRMTEAMNLLRFSDRSVKEVAASVGFNDPLYFSRRFHEHWDIAPSAVRK